MSNTIPSDLEHPIDEAARLCGGRAALAAFLGVTVGAIGNWKIRSSGVPWRYCRRIEARFPTVTRQRLRPNDYGEVWTELIAESEHDRVPIAEGAES
jgi:DNA-binding transcriptional regulator YdaS (Cro superfamily)